MRALLNLIERADSLVHRKPCRAFLGSSPSWVVPRRSSEFYQSLNLPSPVSTLECCRFCRSASLVLCAILEHSAILAFWVLLHENRWKDASKKHSQCFIKLPDMVASAGAWWHLSFLIAKKFCFLRGCLCFWSRLCLWNDGKTTQSRGVPQRWGRESSLSLKFGSNNIKHSVTCWSNVTHRQA